MEISIAAFAAWLLLPQLMGVAVSTAAWRVLQRFSEDRLVAQLVGVLAAPVFVVVSKPWFGTAAEAGAQRCGAWGALVFFAMLPVVFFELLLATGVQIVLGLVRESFEPTPS